METDSTIEDWHRETKPITTPSIDHDPGAMNAYSRSST
jgi:hypothetical protein